MAGVAVFLGMVLWLLRSATGLDEEVDGDDERALDDEVMSDARRDGLGVTGDESHVQRRLGGHIKPDGSLYDPQTSPCSVGYEMAPAQGGGKCLCVEGPRCSHQGKTGRQLCSIAERAVELGAHLVLPACLSEYPRPILKRRVVTNVLAV